MNHPDHRDIPPPPENATATAKSKGHPPLVTRQIATSEHGKRHEPAALRWHIPTAPPTV
jgi:hypothetical protein